jgi:hypothetical protein
VKKAIAAIISAMVIVAVVATASLAAGPPPAADKGLDRAAEVSGKDVPVRAGHLPDEPPVEGGQAEEPTVDDPDVDEPDAEVPTADAETASDHCAVDPRTLTPEQLDELNHGAIVCWAAHQDTPEGFKNHGAWVSSWAKDNHGHGNGEAKKPKHHGKPAGNGSEGG